MKKVIFGIFAHPDDEAFGPSGTFLKEVAEGAELHLITLTLGQNGANPDGCTDLGEVRRKEWQTSGGLLGASSQHEFGYIDGRLCNIEMVEIAAKIEQLVLQTIVDRDVTVDFICFDTNGLTGHIDHIVATRAACLAFYRMKLKDGRLEKVRLFCLPTSQSPVVNVDWIYMDAGRKSEEVNEVIDSREFHENILAIIRAHHSQRSDGEARIQNAGQNLGLDHFIILT